MLLSLYIHANNASLINQCLITLTEYCQGPCHENQVTACDCPLYAWVYTVVIVLFACDCVQYCSAIYQVLRLRDWLRRWCSIVILVYVYMPYFVCGIECSIMAVNRSIDISNEMTCTYSLYAYCAVYALMLSICCHSYSYLLFEVPFPNSFPPALYSLQRVQWYRHHGVHHSDWLSCSRGTARTCSRTEGMMHSNTCQYSQIYIWQFAIFIA